MAKPTPSLTMTFTWLESSKTWLLEYHYPTVDGRAVVLRRRKIVTDTPMDAITAAHLATAVEDVLYNQLNFGF